jgi:hypothetical protein
VNGNYEKVTKKSIMKKWILFLLLLFALVGAGCSDRTIQEEEPEKEWEPGDSISFCTPVFYTGVLSLPLTEGIEMPEWLAVKVEEIKMWLSTTPSGLPVPLSMIRICVYRIEWKNHIFYMIYNNFSSKPMSNVFYENGEWVLWKLYTQEDSDSFCAGYETGYKNWTLIYNYGEHN